MNGWRGGLLVLGVGARLAWSGAPEPSAYQQEIEAWRQQREARLKAEGGWLSVVGLFWLEEGETRLGTAPDNAFVLPEGSAPEHAGGLERRGSTITLRLEPGVEAKANGQPVTGPLEMRPDSSGEPTVLSLGPRLQMHVIERGGRFGVRLKDTQSPRRLAFEGLRWFPVREDWRVEASFEPYTPPHSLQIQNVLGQMEPMQCPGAVVFRLDGQELRLEPVVEDPNEPELFFIFRDGTSGRETYGAGRFLYTPMPKDGKVVLDFNRAYSPPCAFTDFATCPLPPPGNRLPIRIEAGEQFTHAPEP